ncbi:MAG: FAD-binding protein [Coriobacteriales bacterium]|jgi:succinate dehydrogenase/fumarate reductase flavoprotein subunit|nr:FAD-binding protein [Coriobacteriales bacterium]
MDTTTGRTTDAEMGATPGAETGGGLCPDSPTEGGAGRGLSRRAFLGGLGTAAAAMAVGLTACAPGGGAGEGDAAAGGGADAAGGAGGAGGADAPTASKSPAFLTAPPAPQAADAEESCDVLVIGLGLAGIAAAREAVEAGKSVIVAEKQAEETYSVVIMAGDFGVVGSQIQKDLGIEWAPKTDIVNQLQKDMTYRTNPVLLNYWYDHSGEDFDWFVEGADFEILPSSAANKATDKEFYIRPKCFPPLAGYDWKTEYYPYFHGTITTNPNMQWACDNSRDIAIEKGAKVLYDAKGEQLITDESGAVTGAWLVSSAGSYTKVNAKAVVLATGDFGNNLEMREYYVPWTLEFTSWYPQFDPAGVACNTGDGQLMGIWAGGEMELGPLAPMTHHMGGPLGVDAFLQLNLEGHRFMNEDIPGQNIADQLSRQPGKESWQLFDAKWPEQLLTQPTGHGYVNYFVGDDQIADYETVLAGFGLGYTTRAMVEDAEGLLKADTIEDLAAQMGLDAATVKAEVDRYNELCAKGYDEDFGKDPRRLYPLAEAPFFAYKFGSAGMLVQMGGLRTDLDLHVLAPDNAPIPGLFATGNNMGGRFVVEYPVTVAGISLGTALCFGRLAGKNAAAGL